MVIDEARFTHEGGRSNYAVECWFAFHKDETKKNAEYKVEFQLEVRPFDNDDKRKRFLKEMESNGLNFPRSAEECSGEYTRIGKKGKSKKLLDTSTFFDTDNVLRVMNELYDSRKGELNKVAEVMKGFNWSDLP